MVNANEKTIGNAYKEEIAQKWRNNKKDTSHVMVYYGETMRAKRKIAPKLH